MDNQLPSPSGDLENNVSDKYSMAYSQYFYSSTYRCTILQTESGSLGHQWACHLPKMIATIDNLIAKFIDSNQQVLNSIQNFLTSVKVKC